MKIQIHYALAAMAITAISACSDEPQTSGSDKTEEYVREFVKDFGVPADGHDYCMARRAGLKVKSSETERVQVTATIDGVDYLFANLTVHGGITAVPVTLPRAVDQVQIHTSRGIFTALPDATVDIDGIPDKLGRKGNVDITYSDDYLLNFTEVSSEADAPLLVLNTSKFLKKFFSEHPAGKDNTNYQTNLDADMTEPVFYGETILGSHGVASQHNWCKAEYYVFPIWWRTNGAGCKDYSLIVYDCMKFNSSHFTLDYWNASNGSNPFPYLGYMTEEVAEAGPSEQELANVIYADASASQAYPIEDAATIVSRGLKLEFDINKLVDNGIAFCLRSANDVGSDSHSVVLKNAQAWNDKYFDVSLDELHFANVSTMQFWLDPQSFTVKNSGSDTFESLMGADNSSLPFLLGFNSAPSKAADNTARDYLDAMLLIVPTTPFILNYNMNYPMEPFTWTIAAEDLGGSCDWDFNDAVFSFTDLITDLNGENDLCDLTIPDGPYDALPVRKITVKPLAAGGTMPLYITYTGEHVCAQAPLPSSGTQMYSEADAALRAAMNSAPSGTFIVGREIHKWLGASNHTKQLNTDAKRQRIAAKTVSFCIPADDTTYSPAASGENQTLAGFAVLVDKENALNIDAFNDCDKGMHHVPDLSMGNDTYLIGAPSHDVNVSVPQMLLVSGDWEWPREYMAIDDAYPDFTKWVSDPSANWLSNKVSVNITAK